MKYIDNNQLKVTNIISFYLSGTLMDKKVYEFISKQTNDPIVERRVCRRTGQEFPIFQGDVELLDKISPVIGGQKFSIPFPTLSPMARMRRRMMFRNERGLYAQTSALSGKKVISMYHPDMVKEVVAPEEMFADTYNPFSRGIDYDPKTPFLKQYKKLRESIIRPGTTCFNNINGGYNAFSSDSKNIYLCADTMRSEDTLYSTTIKHIRNGVDLLNVWESDYVYECVSSHHMTKCIQARYCEHCYDCAFITTCKNCTNCYLCSNLSDKQNYLLNKPASKEEIAQFKAKMKSHAGMQDIKEQFQKNWDIAPRPASRVINAEKSCGSVLSNSKEAFLCFDSHDLQNCRYCIVGEFNADVMDCTIFNPNASQVYEQVCGGYQVQKSAFATVCRQSSETFFSEYILSSHHMLGCINMQNADHCILNKQYSKAERETLAQNVIEQLQQEEKRGEFFDTTFSPFPYNDTVADEYYPIKTIIIDGKEQIHHPEGKGTVTVVDASKFISDAVLDLGGTEKIKIKRRTRENEINIPAGIQTIQSAQVPSDISEVQDDILEKAIICSISGRPFKLSVPELTFYRKNGFPLPHKHPDIRHQERLDKRPGRNICVRDCSNCKQEMLSVYTPEYAGKVYCETCYNKEIYG